MGADRGHASVHVGVWGRSGCRVIDWTFKMRARLGIRGPQRVSREHLLWKVLLREAPPRIHARIPAALAPVERQRVCCLRCHLVGSDWVRIYSPSPPPFSLSVTLSLLVDSEGCEAIQTRPPLPPFQLRAEARRRAGHASRQRSSESSQPCSTKRRRHTAPPSRPSTHPSDTCPNTRCRLSRSRRLSRLKGYGLREPRGNRTRAGRGPRRRWGRARGASGAAWRTAA